MTVRIGFAGGGFIAGMHAQALHGQPDVELAAVFDPEPGAADEFAKRTGARPVESFEALIEASDAVYVCCPNALHAELAVEALRAGKHVFSEKPMATSAADAEAVAKAAKRAKGVYQIGFNKRFAPVYAAMKERIEAGDLTPRWAHVKMNRGELQKPAWVADASLTGGYLYETPIHLLDMMEWLFGPATEVVCRAAQTCAPQLDDFAMLFTFRSGVTATFCSCAHATWLYPFERFELYGEHAAAVSEEMDRVTFQVGLDARPETLDVSDRPVPDRWGYAGEDAAFLAAVRGERAPAVGAAIGERAVRIVEACYRAAETDEAVSLD